MRFLVILALMSWYGVGFAQPLVAYDIVYVRSPRHGDTTEMLWQEVVTPTHVEPGTDLVILHPDGTETLLVASLGIGAAVDPAVSFDGQWVYYTYYADARIATAYNYLPGSGSDLYKIHVNSGRSIRLTFQEWTPTTGAGTWSRSPVKAIPDGTNFPMVPIFNSGACPLPGGKVAFVSTRNTHAPNSNQDHLNFQLFVLDEVSGTTEQIGYLNLANALHPTVLMDGRIMFSSQESQGMHDGRLWGLWGIWPDGRKWEPLLSAFGDTSTQSASHFSTQLSDGRIVVTQYYNQNNNGFGVLLAFNNYPPALPLIGMPRFGSPSPNDPSNPPISRIGKFPFSPVGLVSLTPFAKTFDANADLINGVYAGKTRDPSAAPNNDMLLTYSPGPVHRGSVPAADGGIYLVRHGQPASTPSQLVLIKNDPLYNEHQPRPLVPYQAIYGMAQPAILPWLPNDGTLEPSLPAGTPYGLIGTSSFYKRNTTPGKGLAAFQGLEPFNTSANEVSWNWVQQGAEAGVFTNEDIEAVRLVVQSPTANRKFGPNAGVQFFNYGGERLRILGEIPLRKVDAKGLPVLDIDGNPDTSFVAKIPADMPFTFQMLDHHGTSLSMAQTWHQVRPGEARYDCGGCHAHAQIGTDFHRTAAAQPGFVPTDLTQTRPTNVEYYQDIQPLLRQYCVGCHTTISPQGQLALDAAGAVGPSDPTYARLVRDPQAQFGYKPVITTRTWRQYQSSRYVRPYQSRRSLLTWVIYGQRLDGWANTSHPTETVPGDVTTLPVGTNTNDADVDYTPALHSAHVTVVAQLSAHQQRTVAAWIDLGVPINGGPRGWFLDENRPTLAMTQVSEVFYIGLADNESGVDISSLRVWSDRIFRGLSVGSDLAPQLQKTSAGVWAVSLPCPFSGLMTAHIRDYQGNTTQKSRHVQCDATLIPPVIMTQPLSQTVTLACQTATFVVGATGSPPLLYQWYHKRVEIDGATNATYATSCLTPQDNDTEYGCTVTNAAGQATCQPAVLTLR